MRIWFELDILRIARFSYFSFSIWNAMVGSALLTMPWALNQAGFFLGLGLFCVMPIIAFYTAYLIIKIPQGMSEEMTKPKWRWFTTTTTTTPSSLSEFDAHADFPEIIGYFWGRRVERFAASFSVVVLFGGVIVYWILMSNFLFGTGTVIHGMKAFLTIPLYFLLDHCFN